MRTLLVLLKRDLKNSLNNRLFILLLFLLLFQFWFVLGSDSVGQVSDTGVMHFMAVVFAFNFFGSIAALTLNHDGISIERETKFLDLILTSGGTKKKVYISKILTSFLISGIFAMLYVTAMLVIYFVMSGDIRLSLNTFRYFLPLSAFLSLFSLMGLMISVILRSSKASLITSIIIGGVLMPRLLVMFIDSLSGIFGLGEVTTEILYMLSPALIMNVLNGYSERVFVNWGLFFLVVYLVVLIVSGMYVFVRQDELNFGE